MEKNSPEWWQNQYARLPRINEAMTGKGKGKPKCRECGIVLEKKEKVVCVFCVREGARPN
jgi:hypothetical protein